MPISLAQISLGCSENFFPPLIFKSQGGGGIRFLQGCRFVVRAPKHRDAKNFFAHQLQARSHRHALRQCLDDSIPEAGNQRRPAGCSRTIQLKINEMYLIISFLAPKTMMDFDMKDLCSEFCCVQVLVKDYTVVLPIFSFIDYYLCSPAAH